MADKEELNQEDELAPDTVQEEQELDQQEEETPVEQEQEEEVDTPPAKKFVEFNEEQQAKFNDLYKQVKMSDARNKMYLDLMEKQQAKLDELETRFSKTDDAEAEKMLNARLRDAQDNGDVDLQNRVMQELIDFRVDKKMNAAKPVKKQPVIQQDPDERYVTELASEKDESGQMLRPWLDDTHPDHEKALAAASRLSVKYMQEHGDVHLPSVMKQLDIEMKKQQPPKQVQNRRAPDPLSSNLTNRNLAPKLKLSDAERSIAVKLGVKPEEYARNR